MRYLNVVTQYVIPLDVDPSSPDTETVINSAVSMMEEHMKKLSPRMTDVKSHWSWMPRWWQPGIDEDARRHVYVGDRDPEDFSDHPNYPSDAPPHPWDQGLWIFPDGHPLAKLERHVKARMDAGDKMTGDEPELFLKAHKELNPGE